MKKSFKTNAKCGGCVAKIAERLNEIVPAEAWSIDLTSADRLLTDYYRKEYVAPKVFRLK